MRRDRRKKIIRFFEVAALAVVAVDLAVYFLAVRPQGGKVARAEDSYHQASMRLALQKAQVARLEKFQEALPVADDKLKNFLQDHVPSRQRVYSDALHMMNALTRKSGVQLDSLNYKLSSEKDEPFEQLGLDVTVEGPFANLLKFAHSLETSDNLILVRNFSFAAGQGSTVNLRIGGVLYLTP
ncbi:MAG TPA: type 4a pilus biogenesis protein PilO [Terriglobia bacterium]|nr:type 4a pilus biogenesis protein PilO [Terriglobia bacterium]